MAITGINFQSGSQLPGQTITITKPTGLASGDVMLWAVAIPFGYTISTLPTGATLLASVTDPTSTYTCALYTQLASGTEPASYTWTLSGSYWWSVECYAVRGADIPTLYATQANAASTTMSWASLSIPSANGWDMLIGVTGGGGSPFGSITNYVNITGSLEWPNWLIRTTGVATGATGTKSLTMGGSTPTATIHFFIPDTATTGGGGTTLPPTSTTLPTITGTPGRGNTVTGHLGTWANAPTSYNYEFRWLRDPQMQSPYKPTAGYQTIPGTAGTTSSAATTPTYVMGRNDASQSIVFHVTAVNAGGSASADSSSIVFYGQKIPFKQTGNPFYTTQASSSPVYSAELSSLLQSSITNYRASGTTWWMQGGNTGDTYSVYLHRVDSSMPRTPFMIPQYINGQSFSNPKVQPLQNGGMDQHLAWSFGVKNGGVPTPPGGFRVANGNDAHLVVFVEDTFEMYEMWVTWFITPGQAGYSTDYDNQWACFWGGYMRDVREHDGRWFGDTGFGSSRYRYDVDGNLEYAGWGGTATSIALAQIILLEQELVVDSSIGHGLGMLLPGHQSTYFYPGVREAAGEPTGPYPQGTWITLDPALSIAGLPTLGTTAKDNFRAKLLTPIQTYGVSNFDTTIGNISFKTEAMGGTWPNIPNVDNQGGAGMSEVMDSIPITAWKVLSPSWRPAGRVLNAKMATITDAWTSLNFAKWNTGGTISATGGQLTLTSTGSNCAIWPANWGTQSLVGSTCMTRTDTMPAGATKNSFGIQPLNTEYNSPGLRFNIVGGNLRCELYDWYGYEVGTPTVVAFSAANHKFVRFRMNADHSVDWQTAPDNGSGAPGTWTTQRTAIPLLDLEDANISYELTGPATTTAVWGPLNITSTGSAPANTTAPLLSPSSIAVGGSLSVSNGIWSNTPTGFAYQWQRAGVNIAGATSGTYVTVPGDSGQPISCIVTASNAFGSAPAASSNTVTPSAGSPAPVNTVVPGVTPTTAVAGTTLSTTNGTWNNTPTSFAYQWRRAGVAISGATASTYVVQAADIGQAVTCVVTATNAVGSASATSNAVTPTASTVTWVLGT